MKFSFVAFGINVALSLHCEGSVALPQPPPERYNQKIYPKDPTIRSKDR